MRSGESAPKQRIARPGPGKRMLMQDVGIDAQESAPISRTSSLKKRRSGSMSLSRLHSSGKPPTLWWLLMVWARATAGCAPTR